MHNTTPDKFNDLQDPEKEVLLSHAIKVYSKSDNGYNYDLFKIEDFYIEVKISYEHRVHRIITAYSPEELPAMYEGEV